MSTKIKVPCGGFFINPTLALNNGVLGVNAKVLRVVMEQNPDARGDEPSESFYIADDSDYKDTIELVNDLDANPEVYVVCAVYSKPLTSDTPRSLEYIAEFSNSSYSDGTCGAEFVHSQTESIDFVEKKVEFVISQISVATNESRENSVTIKSGTATLSLN